MKTGPGLYWKYRLTNLDGSPVDPEGSFFVFRHDTDPHARAAIAVYANSKGLESTKGLPFNVAKTDGTPVDAKALYFVVRLDKDRRARKALRVYAELVFEENPGFARELSDLLWDVSPGPACNCREAMCGHYGPEWAENALLARKVGLL
jgi:hypothetical protein